MFSVALTGGIGCGKTLVSDYFQQLGAPVIDTDIISRDLVQPGCLALNQLSAKFGSGILKPDGQLDRKKLQAQIFQQPEAKTYLENLLHPLILEEVNRQKQSLDAPYCIIVIPLLLESRQNFHQDRVLVVDCSVAIQKQRVLQRDNMTEATFSAILSQQATRQERLDVADDIIENNTNIAAVYEKTRLLHFKYVALAEGRPQ